MLFLAMVTVIVMAGCSEEPVLDQVANTIEQSVNDNVELVQNQAGTEVNEALVGENPKELHADMKVGKASKLLMDNKVGEIKVKAGSGDTISVKATIWWQKSKNASQQTREEIANQAKLSVDVQGEQIIISTHDKNDPKTDLWKWAQKKYRYSNFSIDYEIEVPTTLSSFHLSSDVGNIELTGLTGEYVVKSDVGNVTVKEAQIQGKSSISSETGSLNVQIAGIDQDTSLTVNAEVGSIKADLASGLKCSLTARAELGSVTGVEKGLHKINGGGAEIKLTSSIGSIDVTGVEGLSS
ncbi:hypothetical protein DCC85_10135 [Paenibacillus sp. CAA11]|uniref:hypothetical protein n=1 Tax=Paenibacillus sp. CAA11 TaxID=1532905 RepID=UPI000D35E8DB|nr:hypothetical protein [Paenibacillus sp. CAA11]AWB44549.1 hypothetical protein DCC85_10135 [Paenibacillus sp. CAA11]